MLKERTQVVGGIADKLKPAEEQLDTALAALAGLNAHLPTARSQAGLALCVGHDAIEAFSEAQSLMVRARAKVIEGHRALEATRQNFRFPELANGGLGDKSPTKVLSPEGHLRIVGG